MDNKPKNTQDKPLKPGELKLITFMRLIEYGKVSKAKMRRMVAFLNNPPASVRSIDDLLDQLLSLI